jgi:CheY-like chemotaxis protein
MSAKKVIAFANDNRTFSRVRIEMLENLGYEVIFCGNSSEVLQLFERPAGEKPVMLVTDGFLAYGDEFSADETEQGLNTGAAIYKRLRAQDPKLPVVFYGTEPWAREQLRSIGDPCLEVVNDESVDSSTGKILAAAKRLLSETVIPEPNLAAN